MVNVSKIPFSGMKVSTGLMRGENINCHFIESVLCASPVLHTFHVLLYLIFIVALYSEVGSVPPFST